MVVQEPRQIGAFRTPSGNLQNRASAWWARQDSNLQPDRYERPALTIELRARRCIARKRRPPHRHGASPYKATPQAAIAAPMPASGLALRAAASPNTRGMAASAPAEPRRRTRLRFCSPRIADSAMCVRFVRRTTGGAVPCMRRYCRRLRARCRRPRPEPARRAWDGERRPPIPSGD